MLNRNDSFQVSSSCYIIVNAAKSGFLRTLESVDAADYCIRLNCENHLVTHDTDYEDDVLLMIFLQWFTSEDKNRKSNDNDNDNIFNNNNIDDDVFICIYLCPASTYDHAYHDEIFLKTLEFQKKQEYCTSLHTTSKIFHVIECCKTYKTSNLLRYNNHDDLKIQPYNIIDMDMKYQNKGDIFKAITAINDLLVKDNGQVVKLLIKVEEGTTIHHLSHLVSLLDCFFHCSFTNVDYNSW